METSHRKIEKLLDFKERDKFSLDAWNTRGLNPSSDEVCQQLTNLFDNCAGELVSCLNEENDIKKLKIVLKKHLAKFDSNNYDTEEREFICDLFFELASVIEVDFKKNLNRWLYGAFTSALLDITQLIKAKKIIETQEQLCDKCQIPLKSHVVKKEEGASSATWVIGKCTQCGEFNLFSYGDNIKELKFENYYSVEFLNVNDYTYEQALIRLEQIRHFRK